MLLKKSNKLKSNSSKLTIELLFKYGVHIGHSKNTLNKTMLTYVSGYRKDLCIIDITATYVNLQLSLRFLKTLFNQYKTKNYSPSVIFIGTSKKTRLIAKLTGKKASQGYIINKWIPGFCSNFDQQRLSIIRYRIFEQKLLYYYKLVKDNKGSIKNYKKYKSLYLSLRILYHGLIKNTRKPSVFIFLNPENNKTALVEANKSLTPTIALADTNADITYITYAIPGNNDSLESLAFFGNIFSTALLK